MIAIRRAETNNYRPGHRQDLCELMSYEEMDLQKASHALLTPPLSFGIKSHWRFQVRGDEVSQTLVLREVDIEQRAIPFGINLVHKGCELYSITLASKYPTQPWRRASDLRN